MFLSLRGDARPFGRAYSPPCPDAHAMKQAQNGMLLYDGMSSPVAGSPAHFRPADEKHAYAAALQGPYFAEKWFLSMCGFCYYVLPQLLYLIVYTGLSEIF